MTGMRIGLIGGVVGIAALGYGLYRFFKARNRKTLDEKSLEAREAHVGY